MKKGNLMLGLKTGALALCLAATVPLSANAATVVKPDGTGLDESKMTEEEKKKYPENFHFADAYPVYEMAGKVDACITHGGQGTIYSVLAAGKPFIGIPLFMEQQYNLETMQKKHYGILLPKDKVTKETIEEALNRAFNDKELIEGAKEGGEIVRKYLIDPEYSAESKAAEIIKEYLDEKTD